MKATIWKTKVRGIVKWAVAHHVDGKLIRKFYDSEEDAQSRLDELSGAPDTRAAEWALIPDNERWEIIIARKMVKDAGHAGLGEFVAKYLRASAPATAEPTTTNGPSLKEVAESFVRLRVGGWAASTASERLRTLNKLANEMGQQPIDEVTPEIIQQWLEQWPGKRTQQTKRDHISILFNYAVEREWCRKNPCKALPKLIHNQEVPTTFPAAICEQILRSTTPDMIAYFTLCMFGGMRCCEVRRAKWDQIDLAKKLVHVPGASSKTHKWRDVSLPENAVAWLKVAKRNGNDVSPSKSTIDRRQRDVVEKLKLDWDENILRHTAASMMAASGKTVAEITDTLGHDERMFFNHYRARVTREEATAFYSITPFKVEKIVA